MNVRRRGAWQLQVAMLCLGIAVTERALARGGPASPEQARAWNALSREFEEQVKPREAEVRAYARQIVLALQTWQIDSLVEECVMYSANVKDRAGLTRRYLEEHKRELQDAVKQVDVNAPGFARELQFRLPEPSTGMQGQVSIPFGPKVPPPQSQTKDNERYPSRHELELWWSGPLMPNANGPVHATVPPGSKPGRWRFYQLVLPYSHTPTHLL